MWKLLLVVNLFSFDTYGNVDIQDSVCNNPPQYWVSQLDEVNANNQMSLDKKITALNTLKSGYFSCSNKKDWVFARIVHRLGSFYIRSGEVDKAILLTKEAVEINRTDSPNSEKSSLSSSYFNLGYCYRFLGFNNEALNYFDSTIQVGIAFPDNSNLVKQSFLGKAGIYRDTGEFQKCIETADQGMIFSKGNFEVIEGRLLIQKIQAQIELNFLDQAKIDLMKLSIIAFGEKSYPDIVNGYYTTNALLLKKENLHQKAIENLEKSLAINQKLGNENQSIRNLIDIGFTYDEGLEQKNEAIDAYKKALQLALQNEQPDLTSLIYSNLGVAYWRSGAYKDALFNYQLALRSLGLNTISTTDIENPSIDEISDNLNSRLIVTILGNKATSLLELSKTDGDIYLDASINTHKLAVKMIDHMRWNQLTQESKLYWRNISKEVFENALEACTIKQDVESAYFFLEKSRAVMLSDKLSELGARQYIPLQEKEKENRLRNDLYSLRSELAAIGESDPEYSPVKLKWLATSDSLNNFVKNLEQKYPAYFQYKYDTTFYGLHDLKKAGLDKDQSFLSLFVGEKHVYKLFVEQDKPTLKKMEAEGFTHKIDSLMKLVSNQERLNRNYPSYTSLAYHLYDAILGDLPLTNKRLIISLDDVLFPFDILITDPTNPSSYLLSEYAVSYTYSADYLIKNKLNQNNAVQSLLGIAPVSYAAHLKQVPLPGADLSLERIQNQFSSSKLLTFSSATKENFLNNLNQFGIIQLYSHAEADDSGTEPYLIFVDNILNLSELQFIEKSLTQLIILSACNTGVGEFMRGEGVFSLARAFSAAGIPSGINSLWKIDSETTFQITELFHEFLSDGLPTDLALQNAKLAFINHGDGYEALPYFWGASILIGPSIKFDTGKKPWIWIAFGAVLIGFLVAWGTSYLKKVS